MTSRKYKKISNDLLIIQAQMVSMGVNEKNMYMMILKHDPFVNEDEEYFEDVIADLIKMCEESEMYEICESLTQVKKTIR